MRDIKIIHEEPKQTKISQVDSTPAVSYIRNVQLPCGRGRSCLTASTLCISSIRPSNTLLDLSISNGQGIERIMIEYFPVNLCTDV